VSTHVKLTINGRERFPVGVSVVHQQVWVPGAVLLEATSVVLNAIDREFELLEETPAYLFQVHGASVAADTASGLHHSKRQLCATSDRGDESCDREGVVEFHGLSLGSSLAMYCAHQLLTRSPETACRGRSSFLAFLTVFCAGE
jgi:hypothetical protein